MADGEKRTLPEFITKTSMRMLGSTMPRAPLQLSAEDVAGDLQRDIDSVGDGR